MAPPPYWFVETLQFDISRGNEVSFRPTFLHLLKPPAAHSITLNDHSCVPHGSFQVWFGPELALLPDKKGATMQLYSLATGHCDVSQQSDKAKKKKKIYSKVCLFFKE